MRKHNAAAAMNTLYEVKKRKSPRRFWSTRNLLTFVFVFLAGASLLFGMIKRPAPAYDPDWLPVDGFVLSAEIESHLIEGPDKGHTNTIFYDTAITYQYRVNDKTFQNRSILGGINKNDPTRARQIMADYPMGSIVPIRYNPDDPARSMIENPMRGRSLSFFIAGLVFMVGAFFCQRLIKDDAPALAKAKGGRTVPPGGAPAQRHPETQPESDIVGRWVLDYQTPSMREIISSSHSVKSALDSDMKAVLASGSETLIVTITDREIKFTYRDANNQGSCDMISDYLATGNLLSLDHKHMDFLMTDIEGFPPQSYTYTHKESRLILVSPAIKGLGMRAITYHLTRAR